MLGSRWRGSVDDLAGEASGSRERGGPLLWWWRHWGLLWECRPNCGMGHAWPWSHGRIVGRPSGLPAVQVVTDEPIAKKRAHTRLGTNSQIHAQGRAALRPDLSKLLARTGGRLETGQGARTAHWLEDRRNGCVWKHGTCVQQQAFGSEAPSQHCPWEPNPPVHQASRRSEMVCQL